MRTRLLSTLATLAVFVVPVSSNYQLRELTVGNGGGIGDSRSASYGFEGMVGGLGEPMSGTNYGGGLGFGYTQMTNVPPAPTIANTANWYNRLLVTINTGGNPSDTLFAVAISTNSFATTQYLKSDGTVGTTLTLADYRSYTGWGGASGALATGLVPGTTYAVKAKALRGNYTEGPFGPSASAATASPTLVFDIDVSATDTDTDPPFILPLGSLAVNTVVTSANRVWVDVETNADSGAAVYAAASGGLTSTVTGTSIPSVGGDLSALAQGVGAQSASASQGSGGPLAAVSPFNGSAATVGGLSTSLQEMFTAGAPVTAGRASFVLKAKTASLTRAATDYQQTLTLTAAAKF